MLVRTFLYRPRCFRKAPAPRSALRPKRVTLRATQGFAPTVVRELIHQEVGPNQKIKRGQIKLTESTFTTLQVLFSRPTTDRASLATSLMLIGPLTPVPPGDSASSPEVTRCSSVPCRPQTPWCGG